jgi:hypothetical protein
MQYKAIEEYSPSNYACYAVTSIKENFTLNTVHPRGLQEYLNYDIYDIGDKTLIAFTKINVYKTDFVYRIISQNYTEDINYENYEFIEDVLNNSYSKNTNAFFIMQSVSDYKEALGGAPSPVDDARRCDLEDYAAVGFLDTNKEGAADVCDRSQLGGDNVKGWTVFLSSMSNIYIVKVEYSSELNDRNYKDWPIRVNYCRTFAHAVKMAYEWNLLNQDPWNSEENIAVRCNKAFIDWSIPQDALDELAESQPDTVLSLYLSGDEDPRKSIEENSVVPEKFKKWFMKKLRYRTLGSLASNYPENLNIPSSMLEKEKTFFETEIYKFCIENELNILSATPVDVLNKAYFSGPSYVEKNNSITDIIKKNIYLQDKELIKEYVKNLIKPVDFRNQTD